MKRILIISLISAAMFLGACAAPVTTPEYTLSVSVSPSGAGSVSPPGGKYESGLQVTLTATSASGYTFDYWDGATSGSSHTVTITMDSNKSTTAHFKVVETLPAPGYSRSNPADIGVPLSIRVLTYGIGYFPLEPSNDYEVCITLLETIRGGTAWHRILARNQFNDPPKAGYEYILAKVRFEYLTGPTPDTTYDVTPVWFNAVSSTGQDYDFVSLVLPDPSIETNLYPGASHEGWVSFLVAQDDTKPLMTFGRNYDGTGGIWFKLY